MSNISASIPDDLVPLPAQRRDSFPAFLFRVPWWLLIIALVAIWVIVLISTDETYSNTFNYVKDGLRETLLVAAGAYPLAMTLGLLVGMVRANPPKPGYGPLGFAVSMVRLIIYHVCTLYVAVFRGLPIVVALLVVAFIIVPALRDTLATTFGIQIPPRIYRETAIVSLAVAYGAFLSETFRAGIQSIDRGQREAARSLGMTGGQVIWLIVLPQAIRRILPPLGNDFVALIKDTSLVSFLGVNDVTQLARQWANNQFQFIQAYFILAVLYLSLTITGSLIVRYIERRLLIPEK